jgi:tyrosinase
LDWQSFSTSPVWNVTAGFGGNGNQTAGLGVGKGSCVTDGPFATLTPVYYNHSYIPHCLSRGFGVGNDSEELLGHNFSPAAIERLLQQESYERLVAQLEGEIHDSIHRLIGGDFRAWTAPNGKWEALHSLQRPEFIADPIFYLHHAQLDRLWWRWLQIAPTVRGSEYTGRHMVNSTGNATSTDRLFLGSLAVDVSVGDVMDTQGKMLCYEYS